jgi:hypothetical protein
MECWKITIVGGFDNLIVSLFGVVPGTQIEMEINKKKKKLSNVRRGGERERKQRQQQQSAEFSVYCIDVTIEIYFSSAV